MYNVVLVTGLCFAFSGADIESDMTSAYSQLGDSCKQHLTQLGS